MTWAIYTTPEDWATIATGFTQVGLTGGEWNRIEPYVTAGVAGWNANINVPPEHPCYETDRFREIFDEFGNSLGFTGMRVVVITHGTKAGWLSEMQRLLNRSQKDREVLRFFFNYISLVPWYAVDPYPPPAGFFTGMQCV